MAASKRQQKNESIKTIGFKLWAVFFISLILVIVTSIAAVYSTHQSRYLLNQLQLAERERNQMQVAWGQLLLEQSSLVSQGRVEDRAIVELGMKIPAMENVVVVYSD